MILLLGQDLYERNFLENTRGIEKKLYEHINKKKGRRYTLTDSQSHVFITKRIESEINKIWVNRGG